MTIIILKIICFALGILSSLNLAAKIPFLVKNGAGKVQFLPCVTFWTIFYALHFF